MSAKPDPKAKPNPDDAPPAKSGKRKLILFAAPVLLLLGGGGGLWFTGILPEMLGMKHEEHHEGAAHVATVPVFVDMPDIVANLNGDPRRPSYLKLQSRLEVTKAEDAEKIKLAMPRLLDMFQTYLREMRPDELRGSAGTYRLREELIARANVAVQPVKVVDVLFTQMLIQ
ncbi:MAG: flagellar basal body-associated FliL family protein [Rhodospirillales bacterium]